MQRRSGPTGTASHCLHFAPNVAGPIQAMYRIEGLLNTHLYYVTCTTDNTHEYHSFITHSTTLKRASRKRYKYNSLT